MNEQEEWLPMEDFPDYVISNFGRVMYLETGRIKQASSHKGGAASVNLMVDGRQNRRGVALLVARAFLPPSDRPVFDTPINLDGNRLNNHVDNLMWRPRWFAIRYHMQLQEEPRFNIPANKKIEVVPTGEIFDTIRECATTYGLLEESLFLGIHNGTSVFPYSQEFRMIP